MRVAVGCSDQYQLIARSGTADLIAASGGHWIFIGLESIDPANLNGVNKGFNKPNEYAVILRNMADRGIYAITSFIFGMDGDTTGIADRTLQTIQS
jgi:hypothetical protein